MWGCRLLSLFAGVSLASLFLVSCATEPEPEVDFMPVQLRWNALSEKAESSPYKDLCVIRVTAEISRAPAVLASKNPALEYVVSFDVGAEGLEFQGIQADLMQKETVEYLWNATCDTTGSVVVKFHNGQ